MHREQLKSLKYLEYFQANQADVNLSHLLQSKAPEDGGNVLFVAGIHGDETAPIAALIKLHKIFQSKPDLLLKGSVSYLLANPVATKKGLRHVSRDLNQTFAQEIDSSDVEGRRAKDIRNFFQSQSYDMVLDLHSVMMGEFRLVIFEKNQKDSMNYLDVASDIGYYATYKNHFMSKSLLSEFDDNQNTHTFGLECGNNKSVKTVSVAFDQMVRTLEYLEMIKKDSIPLMDRVEQTDFIQIFDIRETIKPQPGFSYVDPDVKTGSYIKKGQIYATYKNGYNLAHEDMNLLLPNPYPRKSDKEAGYLAKVYRFKR